MKIKIIFFSFLFTSCSKNFKNENGVPFSANMLSGHYKMDISPFVEKKIGDSKEKSEEEKIATKIIALTLENTVSVDIYFKSNGTGKMKLNIGTLGKIFGGKDEREDFKYELKNDSILVISSKENFVLTIRKFTDNFDHIELINKEKNEAISLEKESD